MGSMRVTRAGIVAIAERYGYTIETIWRDGVYITKNGITVRKSTYARAYRHMYYWGHKDNRVSV